MKMLMEILGLWCVQTLNFSVLAQGCYVKISVAPEEYVLKEFVTV